MHSNFALAANALLHCVTRAPMSKLFWRERRYFGHAGPTGSYGSTKNRRQLLLVVVVLQLVVVEEETSSV